MAIIGGGFELVANKFPADAKLVRMAIDPQTGYLVLIIESDEYPVCHEGAVPDLIPDPIYRTLTNLLD